MSQVNIKPPTYADILKKPKDIKPEILNQYNPDFYNRIKLLLNKLFKPQIKKDPRDKNKYSKGIDDMYDFIKESIKNSDYDCINLIIGLNNIINENKLVKFSDNIDKTNKNHMWVSDNISNLVKQYYNYNLNELKIIDIGGGEGNVLKRIGEILELSNKNLYCIESESTWSEEYDFSNDINYILSSVFIFK